METVNSLSAFCDLTKNTDEAKFHGYHRMITNSKFLKMATSIITPEDLQSFKLELIQELKNIITDSSPCKKAWLKSVEVREMLGISATTLQTLRINGTLPYSKFSGTLYYKLADIEGALEANKHGRENVKRDYSNKKKKEDGYGNN